MTKLASARINTFGPSPKAGFESPSEQLITLTYGQLVQAVQEAIQPLQDEIAQLREEITSLEAAQDTLSDNQLIQLRLIHELKDKSNGPTDTEKERCQRRDKTVQLWRNKTVQFYLRLLPSHISTHLILKSSEELSPASCDP